MAGKAQAHASNDFVSRGTSMTTTSTAVVLRAVTEKPVV